ncbi:MAG: PD40 domain-containing protein [Planctomycetaceae bacterium]|nr:PD40 domain-containing protein [Planctomycetaceae bacterium]
MKPLPLALLLLAGCATAPAAPPELRDVRQLTADGTHAEAYYSYDGKKLVLMAQRAGDKADQIYELDIATRALTRVSTGKGRTTCGYFLPDGRILYSSTHHHGDEPPAPPDHSKGYVWGLYRTYDIFLRGLDGSLKQLTDNDGYDAETTVSPDGKRIIFTSHRDGGIGLYTMNVDGSDLHKVQHRRGYAGGAFFSPDGQWIVYRAAYPKTDAEKADFELLLSERLLRPGNLEIYIARPDGSDERQLTHNGASNWAPSFHPDGKTIVFASNVHAPKGGKFSIYAMNVDGSGVRRLTEHDGFDGFPCFSPDGTKLVFISNRNGKDPRKDLNVFIADWR